MLIIAFVHVNGRNKSNGGSHKLHRKRRKAARYKQ